MILEARSWNQVFGDETVDRARGTEEELVLCLFQLWWLPASFRVWSHHSSLCLHTHHLFFSLISLCCCSVAKSSPTLCDPMDYSMTGFSVLYYPPEFAQTHVQSQWCHPTVSSSVAHFCSFAQSFPASGSFPMSWVFTSGGQSIGTSASASVHPMNIQDWFPLGLTGLISLLSRGLSKLFFSTTVQKHQFFGTQPSLWSNCHIHVWLLEKL